MADDLSVFGQWLKKRRQALDLTQHELAEAVGYSVASIRKMEAGQRRPSKQVAEKMAACLELSPDEYTAFMRFARTDKDVHEAGPLVPLPPLPRPAGHDSATSGGALVLTGEAPTGAVSSGVDTAAWQQPPTNLPAPLTSFVGRGHQIGRIRALLWRTDVRLLTLTGPPGIGKTRLAIESAASLRGEFADGVFFVPLASISDPAAILPAIAEAVGVPREALGGEDSIMDKLVEQLHDKLMLLVLDNFEQVLAGSEEIARLLSLSARLKALATSRAPLSVYGEHEFAVPPLNLPPKDGAKSQSVEEMTRFEAVQLFVKRAQAAKQDFHLTGENAPFVAEICHQLDGLPLAIELAAARSKHFAPSALLAQIKTHGQLDTLAPGMRDLPPRQRTLRGAIAWSYNLLNSNEQRYFRQLGVFVGGCAPDGAGAVWNTTLNPMDLLLWLSDQGLAQQQSREGEPRFALLEAMRQYALEELEINGEIDAVRQAHAEYYSSLAEMAKARLNGDAEQVTWVERLEQDHDNLRVALRWLLEEPRNPQENSGGHSALALRMASALSRFWHMRGYLSEGRRWLALALEARANGDKKERASALHDAATLAEVHGDYAEARKLSEESLSLARATGDKAGCAAALRQMGAASVFQGKLDEAQQLLDESLSLSREIDDTRNVARTLSWLGILAGTKEDYATTQKRFEESVSLNRQLEDKASLAGEIGNLGLAVMMLGDYTRARSLFGEGLTLARELGDKASEAYVVANLGVINFELGDFQQSREFYRESLTMQSDLGDKRLAIESLEGLARAYTQLESYEIAIRLFGAAEAMREAIGFPYGPADAESNTPMIERTRSQLSEAESKRAWDQGRAMSMDEAFAYALA